MLTHNDFPHLPTRLKHQGRYLPWCSRPRRNGQLGKVPCAPHEGVLYPTDPFISKRMMSLYEATLWVQRGMADGIGLTVTPDLQVTVIDVDGCRSPDGTLTLEATDLLGRFSSVYAEVSPSGSDIHLLVPGRLPKGWRRRPPYDIIDLGYVTVTGRAVQFAQGWVDQSTTLADWHSELSPRRRGEVARATFASPVSSPLDTEALLTRARSARNGARFEGLWSGELGGYASRSEGDLVLVMMLLFWGGPALEDNAVDVLFLASGRNRGQWHGPYRLRTLARAREWRNQT